LVSDHSTGVDITDDNAQLNLTVSDVSEKAEVDWAIRAYTLSIGLRSKMLNSGSEKVMDILEDRIKQQMEAAANELNKKLLSNDVAGTVFASLPTFNGMSTGLGSTTGVFEGLAFGSQTNTVAGIAKSSYTATWQHQYGSAGGAVSTSGSGALSGVIKRCKMKTPSQLGASPHIAVLSSNFYDNFKRMLVATNQVYTSVSGESRASLGFGDFNWDGVPVDCDPVLANTGGSTTTLLSGLVLNLKALKLITLKDAWFQISKPSNAETSGYLGDVGSLVVGCTMLPLHLASSGVIVHGEAY
jgi:hypothetical protein